MRSLPSHARAPAVALAASLGVVAIATAPAFAQSVGPSTFVSFEVTHVEVQAPEVIETYTDENPGENGGSEVNASSTLISFGDYGQHELSVYAAVVELANGAPSLLTSSPYSFTVVGDGVEFGHVWQSVVAKRTARATLTDRITLTNVPTPGPSDDPHRVEFFFKFEGSDVTDLDINPPEALFYNIYTNVSLKVTTQLGGTTYETTLRTGQGELTADIIRKRLQVEQLVAVEVIAIDNAFDATIELQVVPMVSLINDASVKNNFARGSHASLFAESADLIGVIVYDGGGNILPGAQLQSQAGYTYPVLASIPPAPVPTKTIVSPTRVLGTDLGTYSQDVEVEQMIDQSGLQKLFTSGETDFDPYFQTGDPAWAEALYSNNWQSVISFDLPLTGYIEFDLGDLYRVDRLAIWNISLEDIELFFSQSPTGPWESAGAFTLASNVAASFSYNPQLLELAETHEAQYMRIEVGSTYKFSVTDTFAYAIVGEIAVRGELDPVPVPEPSAAIGGAAALGTIALLGAWRPRRRAGRADRTEPVGQSIDLRSWSRGV